MSGGSFPRRGRAGRFRTPTSSSWARSCGASAADPYPSCYARRSSTSSVSDRRPTRRARVCLPRSFTVTPASAVSTKTRLLESELDHQRRRQLLHAGRPGQVGSGPRPRVATLADFPCAAGGAPERRTWALHLGQVLYGMGLGVSNGWILTDPRIPGEHSRTRDLSKVAPRRASSDPTRPDEGRASGAGRGREPGRGLMEAVERPLQSTLGFGSGRPDERLAGAPRLSARRPLDAPVHLAQIEAAVLSSIGAHGALARIPG